MCRFIAGEKNPLGENLLLPLDQCGSGGVWPGPWSEPVWVADSNAAPLTDPLLCLSLLICKMERIIEATSQGGGEDWLRYPNTGHIAGIPVTSPSLISFDCKLQVWRI